MNSVALPKKLPNINKALGYAWCKFKSANYFQKKCMQNYSLFQIYNILKYIRYGIILLIFNYK